MKNHSLVVLRGLGITSLMALAACGGADEAPLSARSGDALPLDAAAFESSAAPASEADRLQALLAKGAALNTQELTEATEAMAPQAKAQRSAAIAANTVFRFYNTRTGAHFFTTSTQERDRVRSTMRHMSYDGPAFHAAAHTEAAMTPVWRFYNSRTGVHFYTISENEKNHVLANLPQFQLEGPAYRASLTPGLGLMPLYRFYLGSKGFHFYTASEQEAEQIKATLPAYRYEGVAYYVPNPAPTAMVVSPAINAALPWNTPTPVTVALSGPFGAPVSAALACTSSDNTRAEVLADCSRITAKRLDARGVITVSGGGMSARLSVTGRPQKLWNGRQGVNQGYGLVTTPDGRALIWGGPTGSTYPLLGQGLLTSQLRYVTHPRSVKNPAGSGPLTQVQQVSAGGDHALAVLSDGSVVIWGSNNDCNGGVGARTPQWFLLPTLVRNMNNTAPLGKVVQAAAGEDQAAALLDNGTVLTWGSPAAPGYLQTRHCLPAVVRMPDNQTPLSNVVSIATGHHYTLALTRDGRVYSWGYNYYGALGRGAQDPNLGTHGYSPVIGTVKKSDGADLTNIVQISAGYGTAMALDQAGVAWVWGDGSFMPDGGTTTVPPVPHAVQVPGVGTITMVAAGHRSHYALDTLGRVWSWGAGTNGALGDGPDKPRQFQPHSRIPATVGAEAGASFPQTQMLSIAATSGGGTALLADGRVLNWGENIRANLGQGVDHEAINGTWAGSEAWLPVPVKNEANNGPLVLNPAAYDNLLYRGR